MAGKERLLSLDSIKKEYDSSDVTAPIRVLQGISLDIDAGESLSIVGPSGSGKSTLLNIMGALDRATSGTVRLEGEEISRKDDDELALIRNRKIGFVFQLHHLLAQCTVLENVLIPTLGYKKEVTQDESGRAFELLKSVGLEERINHYPGQLSGGELQRTAVVRSLINSPGILLADEPTGSLDRESAIQLVKLLVRLNREQGLSVVMVTHSLELAGYMSRVWSLQDGRLKKR